jgi:hypothetical protein
MGTSLSADLALKYPITGIADRCARAARDHTTAPPINVMNSRRLMAPRLKDKHRSGKSKCTGRGHRMSALGH